VRGCSEGVANKRLQPGIAAKGLQPVIAAKGASTK